jgi:hypothetical protein
MWAGRASATLRSAEGMRAAIVMDVGGIRLERFGSYEGVGSYACMLACCLFAAGRMPMVEMELWSARIRWSA